MIEQYGGKIFKILWKKLKELKEITKIRKRQRMYKDLGHCFVDLRWKAKDTVLIFSAGELQREPADEVRCIALSSSAFLAAIEEGERMKNGSFKSLFNSSEAQATRS